MPETKKRATARAARPRKRAASAAGKGAAARQAAGKRSASKPEPAKRPAGKRAAAGTLTVVQFRSAIACPRRQRRILRSLGLRGPNDRRELPDHPSVRGMIAALPHLVCIDKGDAARRNQP